MPANLAAHLQSVLKDNCLYASILAMDSTEIAELSIALEKAATVCRNTVYIRTHWNEEAPA